MKKLLTTLGFAAVVLAVSSGISYGQISDQLTIVNGGTDEPSGGYPGYPYTGTLTFTFTHSNGAGVIIPGAVKVALQMASGTHLDSTVAGIPAGWAYHYSNPLNGYLSNTDTIPADGSVDASQPTGYYLGTDFSIPFNIDAAQDGTNSIQVAPQFAGIGQALYQQPANLVYTTSVTVANTPLSVDFSSFVAEANGCNADLTWTTASETDNAYFAVERSFDGKSFKAIGRVDAKTEGFHGERTYAFTDETPSKGANFYRIRQYDVNGRSTISKVAEVTMNCDINNISLYPNPTKGVIYVEGLVGANTVEVYNVLGQVVLHKEGTATTEMLDISKLASGSYTVRVVRNDTAVFTAKVVKN